MQGRPKTEMLKRWALAAGFDRVGIARLERPEHGGAFVRWLERGEHAGMAYMNRRIEARLDPTLLLEGARSAIVVALQYHPLAGRSTAAGDLWPGVARYARGEDYHRLMERRLGTLARRVRQGFPGCQTRPYVDTGPVLERELAAQAGLGAFGKNTNLLHPHGGSWFLVGELLLTVDLTPDPPLAELCGTCSRCLEACPTGALPEPYRLDSNRCISYWTIEHRGPIPAEVRPLLGHWVFGCDICQQVCPLNESPSAVDHPELDLPAERAELGLPSLLTLGHQEYQRRFRHSPMKRARLDGLQRNAAVVMGNRGDRRYVEPLAQALAKGTPLVRLHAAWALGRIGGERARRELRAAAQREGDTSVRQEIVDAIARCEGTASGR